LLFSLSPFPFGTEDKMCFKKIRGTTRGEEEEEEEEVREGGWEVRRVRRVPERSFSPVLRYLSFLRASLYVSFCLCSWKLQ